MKSNKLLISLFFFICLFLSTKSVNADYNATFVADNKCSLKPNASGNCFYKDTTFKDLVYGSYWLDTGDKITVITNVTPVKAPTSGNGSECKSTFSYVSIFYNNKTYKGYACTDNIKVIEIDEEIKKNFPESYWESLSSLKTSYPNWKFVPVNTRLDFYTAVENEDRGSKSLIQYTNSVNALGYLSTDEGNYNWFLDKYKSYSGSNWFAANRDTIAYYMDPRNFLTVNYIWQFEGLSFDAATQTEEVVSTLLNGHYIQKYAASFIEAGSKANVNPVYLASLSKQEVGGATANVAISGKQITYENKNYSGLYNFYNIGATPTNSNGVVDGLDAYRGIVYANGGANGTQLSYSRPWNTEAKAIYGGALFISESYIAYGQINSYLKKWDVVSNYAKENGYIVTGDYAHQYMQNIGAPRSESESTFKSYSALNMVDKSYTFYIPIYDNMPAKTSLPNKNSPNNYLKTLTLNIDDEGIKNLPGFSGDIVEYNINVDATKNNVVIGASSVRSDATISGIGIKKLETGDNKIPIIVTAANGNKRTYIININKAAPTGEYKTIDEIINETKINVDDVYITGLTLTTPITSFETLVTSSEPKAKIEVKRNNQIITTGNVVTGDTLTITSGEESKTFTIVLYGDVSGDGKITILDLLKVQKHLLGSSKLSGAQFKAADVSKDNNLSILDLLKVQKHLLGDSLIAQK